MVLRIVDSEVQLELALNLLENTLSAWAGGRSDTWQRDGRDGLREEGASFSRREDVYLYVHKAAREAIVGAALAARDRDLLKIAVPRKEPASALRRAAFAVDEQTQETFFLVSIEELKRQHIRDPLKRLAGAPQVKRAEVGDREYVLIGPLAEERAADALLALAALHPEFERHIEALGALAAGSDAREEAEVYKVSSRVAREHRVQVKVAAALFKKLRGAGFQPVELKNGVLRADFAASRGDVAVAFEIRADAEIQDFLRSIGQLTVIAPKTTGFHRCVVLPAPREALAGALGPFEQGFREADIIVLMYDFRDGGAHFWAQFVPEGTPPDLRGLFP